MAFVQDANHARGSSIAVTTTSVYLRNITANLINVTYTNLVYNFRPLLEFNGHSRTTVNINGMKITNSTFIQSAMYFNAINTVNLQAVEFINVTDFGRSLIQVLSSKFSLNAF